MRRYNRVPKVTSADIVIFAEKNGTSYYSGANGFLPIARQVFDERNKQADWWGYPTEAPHPPAPPPPVPDNVDEGVRRFMQGRIENYNLNLRRHDEAVAAYDLARRARDGDDIAAAEFLISRGDHEYEGFSVETLVVPHDP